MSSLLGRQGKMECMVGTDKEHTRNAKIQVLPKAPSSSRNAKIQVLPKAPSSSMPRKNFDWLCEQPLQESAQEGTRGQWTSEDDMSAQDVPLRRQQISPDPEKGASSSSCASSSCSRCCWSTQWTLMRQYPSIFVISLLIFGALVASGFAVVLTRSNHAEEAVRRDALSLAKETGQWFSDQLDQAILPLFSLAQFVSELEVFHDLPYLIGPAGDVGSLPFASKPDGTPSRTHRNISGVCDDASLVQRFTEIASTIKRNARMEGVLVNLQLAPQAVVCVLHPSNNTEDFTPPVFMDNTGAIGHDLLWDPRRSFIAKQTLAAEKVIVAGPLTLRQCDGCDPTVEKAFIARLPIEMEHHEIQTDETTYANRWGFAVALINWEALVDRSRTNENFGQSDFEFQLTKTDRKYNAASDSYVEEVVVLAQSPGFYSEQLSVVTTALETTNNEWVMTVGYESTETDAYKAMAIGFTLGISLCISILIYIVLLQKQAHTLVVARQAATLVENARQAAVAERKLNDFLAHEVRNPLAAALSATTFVSAAVQEREPLRDEATRESVKEDLIIIDTSLRFINELLRSMLDTHRAASNQLTFEHTTVSILQDIFEPVAAMLYRRDETFEIIMDCRPHDLLITGDRLRIQQVVLNLARNSAKFVERGYIRLRARVVLEEVCIFVEDSGPGIPEGKRQNLFARFQESLDVLNQGTGVGLSLCKALVDAMEGELYLDERFVSGVEGCPGTRMVVNLKRPPEETDVATDVDDDEREEDEDDNYKQKNGRWEGGEKQIQRRSSMPRRNSSSKSQKLRRRSSSNISIIMELPQSMSVLFVDDDRILRKLALRSLHTIRPQWTVHEAASGEMALRLVESQTYDLIFLDQYMTSVEKALTGTETTRTLRARGVTSIICGLSANDMEQTFLQAGATAFCHKPFPCKKEELERELSRILQL